MKIKARFITSVVETAAAQTVEMPWARGARRAAFKASREMSYCDQDERRSA